MCDKKTSNLKMLYIVHDIKRCQTCVIATLVTLRYCTVVFDVACNIHAISIRSPFHTMLNETSKPVGFELSSNIHIYNAFDIHIYSLSSMNT